MLVIAGSKADTLCWSQNVFRKAKEPKELRVSEGASHMDIYDRPQFVATAVAKLEYRVKRSDRDSYLSSKGEYE